MAAMAASSQALLTPPGEQAGVVEDHDQGPEEEGGDDGDAHPAGARPHLLRHRRRVTAAPYLGAPSRCGPAGG